MRGTGTLTGGREKRGALAVPPGTTKASQCLGAVRESAVENPVKPFELKDELVVCHRHECLRVPARPTSQLGLPFPARPPPDQRLWRVQTRAQLFPPGSQLQQDSRSGGLKLFPQLQLSQQLLSAAEEWGEWWRAARMSGLFQLSAQTEMIAGWSHVCAANVWACTACLVFCFFLFVPVRTVINFK